MLPSSALECPCLCLSGCHRLAWETESFQAYMVLTIPLKGEDWDKRPVFQPNMPLSHPY